MAGSTVGSTGSCELDGWNRKGQIRPNFTFSTSIWQSHTFSEVKASFDMSDAETEKRRWLLGRSSTTSRVCRLFFTFFVKCVSVLIEANSIFQWKSSSLSRVEGRVRGCWKGGSAVRCSRLLPFYLLLSFD